MLFILHIIFSGEMSMLTSLDFPGLVDPLGQVHDEQGQILVVEDLRGQSSFLRVAEPHLYQQNLLTTDRYAKTKKHCLSDHILYSNKSTTRTP